MTALNEAINELRGALVAARTSTQRQLLGVVTSTSPFRVAIGGESTGVLLPHIGSYSTSDFVVIQERAPGDLLVVGKVV